MASITIRNLDDGIKRRLRVRAAEHGRSMEEEAREILRMKDMLNRSLADMSGQSFEKIEKDTDRDYFLSAEEARDYGLIDRVISHPNEA